MMSNQETSVNFCKVDVDRNQDITAQCQIRCMPTFKFYKNGQLLNTLEGAGEQRIRQYVASYR